MKRSSIGFLLIAMVTAMSFGVEPKADLPRVRLPDDILPVLACWFWGEHEFEPCGYRVFLDRMARHSHYNLLTTSLRVAQRELTEPAVHQQITQAAAYARQLGMGIVMDLDVRLARRAFETAHPDELQEMLRIRETPLAASGEAALSIAAETPSDHYTYRALPYVSRRGRLLRVYLYKRGPEGIEPESVRDVTTSLCQLQSATAGEVKVRIRCSEATRGQSACAIVAFTHFTPDVFAPHLMEFQRKILRQYADAPLAGCCKDEWGFPPDFTGRPEKNDYWFSQHMAQAYAQRTGGRDLVADAMLMWAAQRGRSAERLRAINTFQQMCWQRNGQLEEDFYRAVKEIFGPKAMVATHPTWWPHPDAREFTKNGLDWWVVPRDLAQTDEVTPFAVRTALAKKCNSPVWYNMFYAKDTPAYELELWAGALAGGRVNYHPYFPCESAHAGSDAPLDGQLVRGDARVRLLNFITHAPLDCPVAVVFGHACAMNWAGPAYDDVGLAIADALWRAGYPADLIPADEILSQSLTVGKDGYVRYGPQRYSALALYHPEYEPQEIAAFLASAAAAGKTSLFCVGRWTSGFDGQRLDGESLLPRQMQLLDNATSCAGAIIARLSSAGIAPQTPALAEIGWNVKHSCLGRSGRTRLIDGTVIMTSAEADAAGDALQAEFVLKGQPIRATATGVFAIRIADGGALEAVAAGRLRSLQAGELDLQLERPIDLAIWQDPDGSYQGVVQDVVGPIPPQLLKLTPRWQRLALPEPLQQRGGSF